VARVSMRCLEITVRASGQDNGLPLSGHSSSAGSRFQIILGDRDDLGVKDPANLVSHQVDYGLEISSWASLLHAVDDGQLGRALLQPLVGGLQLGGAPFYPLLQDAASA